MSKKEMTEKNPKKENNEEKAIQVENRPQLKKHEAISIRLPGAEEVSEDVYKFNMSFVRPSGQLVHKECTRKIWREINSEELFRKFRYNFDVFTDENDVVHHINAKAKQEFLPPGFNMDDVETDLKEKETRYLELTKDPSGTLRVMRAPSSCSRPTEDEVLESIKDQSEISSGDYLKGRYRVEEIRERDGYLTYYVDVDFKE